ncbi:hypothetical protein PsorP6_010298 [Peronosclerospora sorghi]|uniref:Uncharacterized protein n=1 Tax=Peronosclerospora sorghi TaxID=230839 RepID=A0ACC0VY80_9STRA|nr:hypothetical protein PsorP6_010298 [Peronosclerospora sorghi]
MVILLVNFLLVLSCFSATSTSALVPETFRRTCCSHALTTRGSTARILRESVALVPREIENTVDAVLEQIANTHIKPQTKRRKISQDATVQREHFLRTRLETTTQDLFDKEDIQRWIEYVDEVKAKHPESEISVIPTLVAHFGDEELYKILEHAVTNPDYESLAKKLLAEQVHYWMKTNKAPDEVFDLSGLGKTGTNILENPKFLDYVTYFDKFSAINQKQPTSMVTTILKHQSAADLIGQINHVKTFQSGEVQDVANRLEKDLIEHLIQTQSLDEVLEALEINSLALTVLGRDTLKSICIKLLVGYIRKHPDTKVTVISQLVKRFSENLVVYSIITTNADDAMGVELRPVLLEYWLNKRKSIDDVAKLLGELLRYEEKSDSLATQSLKVWFSYMDYLVGKKPDGIKLLLIYLGEILRPEGLSRFFRQFEACPSISRAMENSPEKMFQELELAEKKEAMIEDTTFRIWLAYKESYERRHPNDAQESLGMIFKSGFTDDSVQQLLKKLKEMLNDKQTPLARSGLLRLDDVS